MVEYWPPSVPLPGIFNRPAAFYIFVSFTAAAIWASISITVRVLMTLKKRNLYFWSMLICTWGIGIRALGNVLNIMVESKSWPIFETMLHLGWMSMVTGFALVLYSRLNLVLENRKTRRCVLYMIILNGVVLHVMTITIKVGIRASGVGPGDHDLQPWTRILLPLDKVQIVVFSLQETIISLLYVRAAYTYLRSRFAQASQVKRAMRLLLAVQAIVVVIDIAIIVFNLAGLQALKLFTHSWIYAIKLELEFVVLNQLVELSKLGIQGFPSSRGAVELHHVEDDVGVQVQRPEMQALKMPHEQRRKREVGVNECHRRDQEEVGNTLPDERHAPSTGGGPSNTKVST